MKTNQYYNQEEDNENGIFSNVLDLLIIICSIIICILLFLLILKNKRNKKQQPSYTQQQQSQQELTEQEEPYQSVFKDPVDFNQLANRFGKLSLDSTNETK